MRKKHETSGGSGVGERALGDGVVESALERRSSSIFVRLPY